MNRRNRNKKIQIMNRTSYFPSVGKSDFEYENSQAHSTNIKKVKIRIQGRPGEEHWGGLSMNPSKASMSKLTIKEAERKANTLAKIEKYKEDKILHELKMIEEEKAKTIRMMKIKRAKDIRRIQRSQKAAQIMS